MGVKQEIIKIINRLPEEALDDLLSYLQKIESAPVDRIQLLKNAQRILKEDKNLLKRLGQ